MNTGTLIGAGLVALVAAGLGLLVTSVADGWADWVVLGAIVLTGVGFGIAAYHREHPVRRRTFIREHGARRR